VDLVHDFDSLFKQATNACLWQADLLSSVCTDAGRDSRNSLFQPADIPYFKDLGWQQWGLKFSYAQQLYKWFGPGFILGRNFIGEIQSA